MAASTTSNSTDDDIPTCPTHAICLFSANVNSLRDKIDQLRALCIGYKPAVFACQETKIVKSKVPKGQTAVSGYTFYQKDRSMNGGGVGLYVSDRFHPKPVKNVPPNLELVAAELSIGRNRLVVASVYRPPKSRIDEIELFLSDLLDFVANVGTEFVCLLGDFNLDILKPAQLAHVDAFCQSSDLQQLVNVPTHRNTTVLDHIYVPAGKTVSWGISATVENHHNLVWAHYPFKVQRLKRQQSKVWVFAKADWKLFKNLLLSKNILDNIITAENVDEAVNFLESSIQDAANQAIPLRSVSDRQDFPYITKALVQLRRRRNASYNLYLRTKSPRDFAYQKLLNKRWKAGVKAAKSQFFVELISKGDSLKSFWKFIRVTTSGPKQAIPALSLGDNRYAFDDQSKAETLADQFDSHWNMATGVPLIVEPPLELEPSWACSEEFVKSEIKFLKNTKAPGQDKIYPVMLKEAVDLLAPAIAQITNRILSDGKWPTRWKTAIVCPIPKIPNSDQPNDFRPISLLSIVSKPPERHVYNLLLPFIEPHISATQFGFLKGRSTVDALFYFEHLVVSGFEKCAKKNLPTNVAAVFFDVSKAFDQCVHDKILTCLQVRFNVPDYLLCVLKSYLADRNQCVRVRNSLSSLRTVRSGIGQGSILGPLLFIAYVNGLKEIGLSDTGEILLYADDLAYLKPIDCTVAEAELGRDVQIIADFFSSVSLKLNINKTRHMVFTLSQKHNNVTAPSIDGVQIESTDRYKYLGVELDPGLSFSYHVRKTVAKARSTLGCLNRTVRRSVPPNVFSMLYMSLIRSVLTYGFPVTYPYYKKDMVSLERVQKYACRLITNNFNYNVDYNSLLRQTGLKPLYRLAMESRLILTWKYLNKTRHVPSGTLLYANHSRTTRSSHAKQLFIPMCKKERAKMCCAQQCARLWNVCTSCEVDFDFLKFATVIRSDLFFERICNNSVSLLEILNF